MLPDPEDIVELTGRPPVGGAARSAQGQPGNGGNGRYLRVWFACAKVYARANCNQAGTEYSARCGKCGKVMRFRIGPGGSDERFFQVTCE